MTSIKKEESKRVQSTAETEAVTVRMSADMLRRLEEWCLRQSDGPSHSEAIRRLVEAGLAANQQFIEQLHDAKSHAQIAADLAEEIGLKAK